MISKEQFVQTIIALREQHDYDKKRAEELSEIYGTDIDPANNENLTKIIFTLLQTEFKPHEDGCDIERFCYELNFGRGLETPDPIWELWEVVVHQLEVKHKEL